MSRPTMQDIIDLDEMLITRHLNPRAEGESLRSCIDRIINWEVAVNLDPAVSSAAQALIELGRQSTQTTMAEDNLINKLHELRNDPA